MQTNDLKIAIIGAGNMGGAIVRGLAKGTIIKTENIFVSDLSEANLNALKKDFPEISISTSNNDVVQHTNIIVLAVKPWLIQTIAKEIKINTDCKILISIAAGIELSELSKHFEVKENTGIFRVIPNTAIEVGQSVSIVSTQSTSDEQQTKLVLSIFDEMGKTFLISESQMNAFMSLSSCGIAYAFRYIRAAMEGGVEMGIDPNTAKKVIVQTLRGAIELLEANNSHPEGEIDKVTTPGGVTIKGLNEMEANGFTNAVIKGLKVSNASK